MTQVAATCPNCGAKITFRWSSSVQTVCEYCKSILVRTDIDLKKVGQVADLPLNPSPIQIGTEGVFKRQSFVAVGRIVYEYEQGTWNEWHIVLNNGSAWLSDAQDDYALTFTAKDCSTPRAEQVHVGQRYAWNRESYTVCAITNAHYRGVEGELPFETWNKNEAVFVDLMSETGKFATIDYSDSAPVLYLGESVAFDDLQFTNLRKFEGWS